MRFIITARPGPDSPEPPDPNGPFDEAAKMRLPRDVAAKVIDQADWLARAKRYGVIT